MATVLHRSKSQNGGSPSNAITPSSRSGKRGSQSSAGRRRSGRVGAAATQDECEEDDDEDAAAMRNESCCGGSAAELNHNDSERFFIEDLPADILNRLFSLLQLQSTMLLGQTCRRLAEVTQEEDALLWRNLCLRDFAHHTDIGQWLQDSQFGTGISPSSSSSSLSRARSGYLSGLSDLPPQEANGYRSLYRILSHVARLVGTWRALGEGPRGAVYHFRWQPDCVEGLQIICSPDSDEAALRPFHKLGGSPGNVMASFTADDRCTMEESLAWDLAGSSSSRCRKAEAAAAVAGSSGGVVGGSPEGTFGHEFMLFMQGTVAPGRRKKKSPGRTLREATRPVVHHLALVDVVPSTSTHPLSGLWQGILGDEGVQVIKVHYCFRKNAARIVATKVTGDDHVGSGMLLWEAEASPLREPWSQKEVEYILRAENLGDGDNIMEAQEVAVNAVAAVHMGRATGEQFGSGKKIVEGRLWRYENGSLGFFWLLKNGNWQFSEFARLDALLQSDLDLDEGGGIDDRHQ